MGGLSDQEIEAIARQIVAGPAGDGPPRPARPARPPAAGELGGVNPLAPAVRRAPGAVFQAVPSPHPHLAAEHPV